jgi:hypothetical protein
MFPEFTREELATGLDAVAMEILTHAGVEAPPINAFQVAHRLGITVALDDRQAGRARYVRLGGRRPAKSGRLATCPAGQLETRPTILLRPDVREERRQWAVAHEIGEHTAHRVFTVWDADPLESDPAAREEVANQLAGRLLLPTDWFTADGRLLDWDLFAIKSRYATASHELIARRMLECRPLVIISIFDQQSLYFRRSNLPGRAPPPSQVELTCWRAVHDSNHPQTSYSGTHAVQGWPIHENGWKREILRAEVDEYAVDG